MANSWLIVENKRADKIRDINMKKHAKYLPSD